MEIAKKVKLPETENSISTYHELNELNEASSHLKDDQSSIPLLECRSNSWSKEAEKLIDWLLSTQQIKEPFRLDQCRKVFGPDKFYSSLLREIQIGPSCPRNRTGALVDDLQKLKNVVDAMMLTRNNGEARDE